MLWLPLDSGPLPTFGEQGVEMVDQITSFHISSSPYAIEGQVSRHLWRLCVRPTVHLSHNRDYDNPTISVDCFDPRRGWDAFRYSCTDADLEIRERTMARYGFAEEGAYDSIRIAVATARARRDPNHPRVIRNTRTGRYLSDATTTVPIWDDRAQARVYHRDAEDEAMTYGARVVPLSVIDVETAVYGHGR